MHDHFAILGFEPQPDTTEEELQEHYDERCRRFHPDAGGEAEKFQELREAYEHLLSPGRRTRHWLQLVGWWEEGQDLEPTVTSLFETLGPLFQRGDELAKRAEGATTALVRSLVTREKLALVPEVESSRRTVEEEIANLVVRLPTLREKGQEAAGEASRVARSLLFLERWLQQLRQLWMAQL